MFFSIFSSNCLKHLLTEFVFGFQIQVANQDTLNMQDIHQSEEKALAKAAEEAEAAAAAASQIWIAAASCKIVLHQ